jgi:hypothetical protein
MIKLWKDEIMGESNHREKHIAITHYTLGARPGIGVRDYH